MPAAPAMRARRSRVRLKAGGKDDGQHGQHTTVDQGQYPFETGEDQIQCARLFSRGQPELGGLRIGRGWVGENRGGRGGYGGVSVCAPGFWAV